MYPLSIELIFYNIFIYLDIKDIVNLRLVCKESLKRCNDGHYWRLSYFKKYSLEYPNNYIKYIQNSYLKKSRNICGICHKYLLYDVVLTLHNCNELLKRCISCYKKTCICKSMYTAYHNDCLIRHDTINNLYKCPLCEVFIHGFLIGINI